MHARSLLCLAALCASAPLDALARPFAITVVDEQTGRGVPLVELETTNNIRLVTDSQGVVAFEEPGLMGQSVFFTVRSHGYEHAKDGFGFAGKALQVTEGGQAQLKVKRLNVAERLYRVTGAGLYRDSVLTGKSVPIRDPLLNAKVFGSDSVVNAIYHGKLRWFWGDTNRPAYPLGSFQVTGAVSELPGKGGLDPDIGVDLTYFADDKGFARGMAPVPGEGPTWIFGLVVLRDSDNHEHMYSHYVKVRGFLNVYEHGMVEYDDAHDRFEKRVQFPLDAPIRPGGQTFVHRDGSEEYVYFCLPYPLLRVRATAQALLDLSQYEAFTCLADGSRLDEAKVERDANGLPRYAWKRNTPMVGPAEQAKLVKRGLLKPDEVLLPLRDVTTGKVVQAHTGSVYWNAYRKRWIMITVEMGGSSSVLGEVWFAEAPTALGPWVYARKIATHDKYSFYNPKQHTYFDKDGGRTIFFEGTYTQMFSGNSNATPRYEYNQVMYKLNLDDGRLNLPVPIYATNEPDPRFVTEAVGNEGRNFGTIGFFAWERPAEGSVPIYAQTTGQGGLRVGKAGETPSGKPLFYAAPVGAKDSPTATEPLYEWRNPAQKRSLYATESAQLQPGYERVEPALCRVWPNPSRVSSAPPR